MPKYFCIKNEDKSCYNLEYWKNYLEFHELDELIIQGMKMERGTDHFYCTNTGEVGLVGESCGQLCDEYKPRNGKNGRCRFSNNCYEPNGQFYKLTKDGKLKPCQLS